MKFLLTKVKLLCFYSESLKCIVRQKGDNAMVIWLVIIAIAVVGFIVVGSWDPTARFSRSYLKDWEPGDRL